MTSFLTPPHRYNVNVDFTRDNHFDIDFNATRVHGLLNNINVNKASRPDDIPGIVLKTCSNHLAYALSLIFKLIYNTGIIPTQWKLSNVVPIHKKGDDKDVRNYRPISLLSNDIRHCREKSIWHLKTPLQSFFTSIKQLAPKAKIYVQSLLPIPSNGNRFGERNALDFLPG